MGNKWSVAAGQARLHLRWSYSDVVAALAIAAITCLLAYSAGALGTFPSGDDAYAYLSRVRLIQQDLRHVIWDPHWYLGYPFLETNQVLPFLLVALLGRALPIPLEVLISMTSLAAMIIIGISIYVIARLLNLPRGWAFGISLLLLSTPSLWNWWIRGGAYIRIYALALLFVAVATAIAHLQQLRKGANPLALRFAMIALLGAGALIHPRVWAYAVPFVGILYAAGIPGLTRKFSMLWQIFLPVTGLTAWFYLPLLLEYQEISVYGTPEPIHDIVPLNWNWLWRPGSGNELTLHPIYLPLVIGALALCLPVLWRRQRTADFKVASGALLLASLSLSTYAVLFGWLRMPPSFYFAAAYDQATWLAVGLIFLSTAAVSTIAYSGMRVWRWVSSSAVAGIFAVIALTNTAAMVPILRSISVSENPETTGSAAHSTRLVVDVARRDLTEQYRLGAFQRRLTQWVTYLYPDITLTGGRNALSQLHKYFRHWADGVLFYRKNVSDLPGVYKDDRPLVVREPWPGGVENYYSSIFWADWMAARGLVMLPEILPQKETATGYAQRAGSFDVKSIPTRHGTAYYVRTREVLPVLTHSEGSLVGILEPNASRPSEFYYDTLDLFSGLALHSRWVVPVWFNDPTNLSVVDVMVVNEATYGQFQSLLDTAVQQGGSVVVFPTNSRTAVSVLAESILDGPGTLGDVLSKKTLAVSTPVGRGRRIQMAVSMQELRRTGTIAATLAFAAAVLPGVRTTKVTGEIARAVEQTLGASQAVTSVRLRREERVENEIPPTAPRSVKARGLPLRIPATGGTSQARLDFVIDTHLPHNQVNWLFPLTQEVNSGRHGVLQVSMWQDCGTVTVLDVVLSHSALSGLAFETIEPSTWCGWRTLQIPLASFRSKAEWSLLHKFNQVEIVINVDPPYPPQEKGNRVVGVRDIRILLLEPPPARMLLGRWVRPNIYQADIEGTRRVVWKTTFHPRWRAYTDDSRPVPLLYAGPGVILALPPEGARQISFYIPPSQWFVIGTGISALTVLILLSVIVRRQR